MREVQLTKGQCALVDEEDWPAIEPFRWHAIRGTGGIFYAARGSRVAEERSRQIVLMHCEILGAFGVDHVDGDGLNNRRYNLRRATKSQNGANMRPRLGGSSRFKGVSWDRARSKWRACIKVDYRDIHLGRFDREEDAAVAYDVAALHAFGEYARLNLIKVES